MNSVTQATPADSSAASILDVPATARTASECSPSVLEVVGMTKRFGSLVALDNVSIRVDPGTVHALLGENGAGKSTLVKCIMGYQTPDEGAIIIGSRERDIRSTRDAHALGLGMVYQHFTLVPNMTVLENLVIAREQMPSFIDWSREREQVQAMMESMPFKVALDQPVAMLSAGEKQKVEILKQLFLRRQILILDEASSVLTPQEVDEVYVMLRERVNARQLSVLMITHKFREVMQFADDVSVLRQGKLAGHTRVADTCVEHLGNLMVGDQRRAAQPKKARATVGETRLEVRDLKVLNDRGVMAVRGLSLNVRSGEILGMAGVSGNGQRELMRAIVGQQHIEQGEVFVHGERFTPSREQMQKHRLGYLPEEPLHNGCVADMSVGENMSLRDFDSPAHTFGRWFIKRGSLLGRARELIERFSVKTQSPSVPIRTLSGGNVQRAILARELSRNPDILLVVNPCFGLDFSATREIHQRLIDARDRGAAVFLVNEDLDELLELSDRLVVISEGAIVYSAPTDEVDRETVARRMAGH